MMKRGTPQTELPRSQLHSELADGGVFPRAIA